MAKNNNLTDFLTDVADAIREKKGTSDKINPQDFSAEILSIVAGDVQMPNVSGTLVITEGITEDDYETLKLILGNNITIDAQGGIYIHFEDPKVLRVLLANITTDDGVGLTKTDVEGVKTFGQWFASNTAIDTFNEMERFTNLSPTDWGSFARSSIREIKMPPQITTILESIFSYSSIEYIDLNNVETIGKTAFHNCKYLQAIDLRKVKGLGESAFAFSSLSGVVDAPNLETCGQGCFNETNINKIANLGSITSLLNSTCNACKSLTEVVLPPTCVELQMYSLRNCTSLEKVNLDNVKILNNSALSGDKNLRTVGSLKSLETISGQCAFMNKSQLELDISDMNNVTCIPYETFHNCTKVTGVLNIPKCTGIYNYAFVNTNISRVENIGDAVLTPESGVSNLQWFSNNPSLTYINLGNSATLGGIANCSNLEKIDFNPEKITRLCVLSGCPNLNLPVLELPNCVEVATSCFTNTKLVKTIILPSITAVPQWFLHSARVENFLVGNVTSFGGDSMWANVLEALIVLAETPPTISAGNSLPNFAANGYMYVPHDSVALYQAATNWSSKANYIKSIKDLPTLNPDFYAICKKYVDEYIN